MKKGYVLLILLLTTSVSFAQKFLRPNEWRKYRKELFFTTGTANFLGDLGGRDKKGTDYSPADLDLNQSRTAFGVGARYRLYKHVSASAKLAYLAVRGNDAETKDRYRYNRNLNFKSNIFEFSGRIEAGFQQIRMRGGNYGVQRNYSRFKNFSHNLYGFIGIGVFYFEPYGRTASGEYVKLRTLHTEGQGLPGGPKQYKNYSFSIPVGGYYKLTIRKTWSFGVELCYRKTFTDYIDDVGSVYYDKNALAAAYGNTSAQMSDPNKGLINGFSSPDSYGNPAQRGDNQKDTYLSLELSLGYIFKQQRKSARLRSKF